MSYEEQQGYELDFDPKLLSRFIFLFNIARHHTRSYPTTHPQIAKSIQNFLGILDELLEFRSDITIGIAKDTLLVGDASMEKNAVFRDLANTLFECDIASFTVHRSVTHEEMIAFYDILGLKPEQIREQGGVRYLLKDAGVQSVQVMDINYSSFHTTELETIAAPTREEEEAADTPWEAFISGMVDGSLSDSEDAEAKTLDPEVLAQMLNEQKMKKAGQADEDEGDLSYDATITSFFKELDKEGMDKKSRAAAMIRLGRFADQLNPDLRRDLLNSTFATIGDRTELAEDMLSGVSPTTLIEIFGEANEDQITVPPSMLNMLAKLAENTDTGKKARVIQQHGEVIDEDLEERIRTIFQAGSEEKFVPETYQKFLQEVMAIDELEDLHEAEVEEITQTLEGHQIEASVLDIILDLIDADPMSEQAELMTQNLLDLVHYFLEVGDYESLIITYDRLCRHHDESEAFSIPIAEETLKIYETTEFTETVLSGLEIWDGEKNDDIRTLIGHVSGPFIEPILDRLADEEDMARRQYLISVLFEIGEPAIAPIIKRLHDQRWYFVRNLIILLRRFDNPEVMQPMRRLIGHKHPKVHLEAMKTYQHFNDPKADLYLLREMESEIPDRRKNAYFLARNSKDPAVYQALINLLKNGKNDPDYAIRDIALKSLAEIGDPNFLPSLVDVLATRNLLRAPRHKEFRKKVLHSFVKYPRARTRPLLEEIAGNPKSDLADTAAKVLRRLPRGES